MALQTIEGYENNRAPAGYATFSSEAQWRGGRAGGVAWRGARGPSSGTQASWANMTVPTPVNALCVGVGIQITGTQPVGPGSHRYLQLRESGVVHLGVGLTAENFLGIYRGDGTLLTATTVPINVGVWNYYELQAVIADGAAGSATLYLNGSKLLEVTAVDTRNGGTNGLVTEVLVTTAPINYNAGELLVDDWYLTDTTGPAPYNGPLGDCKVEALRPNGNGDVSDFVGSDGNSVDNWALVDDVSTTSDYVGSNVAGARDLYQLSQPTGVDLGDVLAVVVDVLAAKNDAGDAPGNLRAVMRSVGGTDAAHLLAIPAQLSTSYQWFRTPVVTADPAGDPWTIARLEGLQLGVEVQAPA